MNKEEQEIKIHFLDISVYYGKTTVEQFLNFGFQIIPNSIDYHEESQTVMCGFSKNGIDIGNLVFFYYKGKKNILEKDLKMLPIHLVLLNDENDKQDKPNRENTNLNTPKTNPVSIKRNNCKKSTGFWNFLEFTGKSGHKDVIFLCCAYLFLLLFLLLLTLFGKNDIPIGLTYTVIALPFIFFGFSLILWGLKRFFSFIYYRIKLLPFVLLCSLLFFIWNAIITFTILKTRELPENNTILTFIPIIIFLVISFFLIGLMLWNIAEEYYRYSLKRKLIYITVNILVVFLTFYSINIKNIKLKSITPEKFNFLEFTNLYITFLVMHLMIYSLLWICLFIKGGGIFVLLELITRNKVKKNKRK